ncbi:MULTISPECIES: phospholipase D family protein [Yersinia pseudotuberculosis complex]|nr:MULTISPECIES: phospholipase D family protein [Yersinia pseudotuberculosis complex]
MMKTHPALILSFILCSSLASAKVQVGFSPDGSAERLVLNTLSQATVSIDLAAYAFTSKQVATVLLAAKRRGVSVRVLADKQSASDRYSAVTFLANQGVSVRLNGRYAIQHSKFALIDGETVQTGSLNYTHSAFTRNAENVVVIRGERAVSQAYQQEFERLWAEGEDLKPSY